MSDLVNQFKAKVDAEEARYHFSEMTDAETPIWIGGPTPFSMLGRYVLTALVLLIHMMFFWAAKGGDLEGEGQLNFVIGLVKILLDISGVTGFEHRRPNKPGGEGIHTNLKWAVLNR